MHAAGQSAGPGIDGITFDNWDRVKGGRGPVPPVARKSA
jgi:hypothetical protein